MKNKKKAHIDTYETVYSVDLVVANESVTLEQLKKLYKYSDSKELDDFVTDGVCSTSTCIRKTDGKAMCLVKYNHPSSYLKSKRDLEVDLINTCCHEAIHVMMDIYSYIEEKIDTSMQEVFAYNVGWAAECIYKTLTKK